MIIITAHQFGEQIVCVFHPDDQWLTDATCYYRRYGDNDVGGIERMSHRALQSLVGRAIVDRSFRDQLLNGNRDEVLADFNLADDELSAIRSIDAHSLETFAGELDDWLGAHDAKHRR